MSDIAVKVENLGKLYHIGARQEQYPTLRSALVSGVKRLTTKRSARDIEENTIWALNDVSFDVKQGEVIGIIGRNGAGKSTLLKVLAHITEPTKGRVSLYGRVGSLLEVGTGFHPELTGRDNIYLNGAILGMTKTEIERKFDEIVAFAEIENFLDTPVKRYSSGMYVRLAFAVAAHMEPEILLVDEVLAVGDTAFQKKCLGKMGDVAQDGRTVLFVSHNMAAIQNLCKRCVLLEKGIVRMVGSPREVINTYLNESIEEEDRSINRIGERDLTKRVNTYSPGKIYIKAIQLFDSDYKHLDTFLMGQQMFIQVDIENVSQFYDSLIGITIKSREEQWLGSINTGMSCLSQNQSRGSREQATLCLNRIPFTPGIYWISISVTRDRKYRIDYVDRAISFSVVDADIYGSGYQVTSDYGIIYLDGTWEIRPNTSISER